MRIAQYHKILFLSLIGNCTRVQLYSHVRPRIYQLFYSVTVFNVSPLVLLNNIQLSVFSPWNFIPFSLQLKYFLITILTLSKRLGPWNLFVFEDSTSNGTKLEPCHFLPGSCGVDAFFIEFSWKHLIYLTIYYLSRIRCCNLRQSQNLIYTFEALIINNINFYCNISFYYYLPLTLCTKKLS